MIEGTSKKIGDGGESGDKMEVEVPDRITYPVSYFIDLVFRTDLI